MRAVSLYAIPVTLSVIVGFGFLRGTDVFSSFVTGAKDGLKTVVSILPPLIGLFAAISVFRASGALDILCAALSPLTSRLGIPDELLTFSLLRPVSGSGSLAMANDIFVTKGIDSFCSRVVSVMMGSTETTFYTIAVYFGAVGVKNTRHTVGCALFADVVCFVSSIVVCKIMFGM